MMKFKFNSFSVQWKLITRIKKVKYLKHYTIHYTTKNKNEIHYQPKFSGKEEINIKSNVNFEWKIPILLVVFLF